MNKIILNTSDEAAKYVENLSGWVSRQGQFFGENEAAARNTGCTHTKCANCGVIKPKDYYLTCNICREAREVVLYNKLERKPWDETGCVYSQSHDKYFQDWDEIYDYCAEIETDPASLRLVICEPVYLRPIDEDHWCDDCEELPDDVGYALEEFNKVLREAGPVSYQPGKIAVEIK